jgi:hypothetical protein
MSSSLPRLGDVVDDYCPRCRLLLNHGVAALLEGQIAKVTCRTCFDTHDYRHAQIPPKRKGKKSEKEDLVAQVLAGMPAAAAGAAIPLQPLRKKRDLWAEAKRIEEQRRK